MLFCTSFRHWQGKPTRHAVSHQDQTVPTITAQLAIMLNALPLIWANHLVFPLDAHILVLSSTLGAFSQVNDYSA